MTPENFCYWLQGIFEVSNPQELSKEQLQVIKDHLALVFLKFTPFVKIETDIKIDKDKIKEDVDKISKEKVDKIFRDLQDRIYQKVWKEGINNPPQCQSGKLCSKPIQGHPDHFVTGLQSSDIKDMRTGESILPFMFDDGPPRSC